MGVPPQYGSVFFHFKQTLIMNKLYIFFKTILLCCITISSLKAQQLPVLDENSFNFVYNGKAYVADQSGDFYTFDGTTWTKIGVFPGSSDNTSLYRASFEVQNKIYIPKQISSNELRVYTPSSNTWSVISGPTPFVRTDRFNNTFTENFFFKFGEGLHSLKKVEYLDTYNQVLGGFNNRYILYKYNGITWDSIGQLISPGGRTQSGDDGHVNNFTRGSRIYVRPASFRGTAAFYYFDMLDKSFGVQGNPNDLGLNAIGGFAFSRGNKFYYVGDATSANSGSKLWSLGISDSVRPQKPYPGVNRAIPPYAGCFVINDIGYFWGHPGGIGFNQPQTLLRYFFGNDTVPDRWDCNYGKPVNDFEVITRTSSISIKNLSFSNESFSYWGTYWTIDSIRQDANRKANPTFSNLPKDTYKVCMLGNPNECLDRGRADTICKVATVGTCSSNADVCADFTFRVQGNAVQFTNRSVGGVAYLWDFGDGQRATTLSPNHQYQSGIYNAKLVVTNALGQKDSIIQSVNARIEDVKLRVELNLRDVMRVGVKTNFNVRVINDGVDTAYDVLLFVNVPQGQDIEIFPTDVNQFGFRMDSVYALGKDEQTGKRSLVFWIANVPPNSSRKIDMKLKVSGVPGHTLIPLETKIKLGRNEVNWDGSPSNLYQSSLFNIVGNVYLFQSLNPNFSAQLNYSDYLNSLSNNYQNNYYSILPIEQFVKNALPSISSNNTLKDSVTLATKYYLADPNRLGLRSQLKAHAVNIESPIPNIITPCAVTPINSPDDLKPIDNPYLDITSTYDSWGCNEPRINSSGQPYQHQGIDYSIPLDKRPTNWGTGGVPTLSIISGKISRITTTGNDGNRICVSFFNAEGKICEVCYSHLHHFATNSTGGNLQVGDCVAKGATLGYVGMTGSAPAVHLHVSVFCEKQSRNHLKDPKKEIPSLYFNPRNDICVQCPSPYDFMFEQKYCTVGRGGEPNCILECPCNINHCNDKLIEFITSDDPNEKQGLQGIGTKHYLKKDTLLSYNILFENKPSASASAQRVVVSDTLDMTKVDKNRFAFGNIAFGETVVNIPSTAGYNYQNDIDFRPKANCIVRINMNFDTTKGIIKWTFQSIDPATNLPTDDPLKGFLPPNINAPQGDGYVSFSIGTKTGLVNEAQIKNRASIVFDNNAAILTNYWVNTIDAQAPLSKVTPLPMVTNDSIFRVEWSGIDAGSNIAAYDVYVSVNNAPFVLWQSQTTRLFANYTGNFDSNYRFYSIATDSLGNREANKVNAEALTILTRRKACPLLNANIGDACNDNNPNTQNDKIQFDCTCKGTVITTYDCPVLQKNIGDPCNYNNPNTQNDKIQSDCTCKGTVIATYDCPTLQKNKGDACNDNNANTTNDKIQSDCTCRGETVQTGALTMACPANMEITIPQGATYSNVSWNLPIANSSCSVGGGTGCSTTGINGFSLLGELNGHQYFLSNQIANWREAKQLCINEGGYLATIAAQTENDYLKSKLRDIVFIGLNDENTEGSFQWANGEAATYTNWAAGQPAQAPQALTEDYVVFQNWSGQWEDMNGFVAKRFVLERNCSNNTTITPPPTLQQTAGFANGAAFPIGLTTVTYSAKDACNNTQTCSFTVNVKQAAVTTGGSYCASKGNSPWEAWIGRVNFKQINQQSAKESYGNFKSVIATVTTNEVIPLSITPNFSYTQHNGFVRAWIDYNGDGDFADAGEMVLNQAYQGGIPNKAVVPITSNITIPATAKLGTTCMRVTFRQDIAPNPCDTWSNSNGEVEDYSVVIGSNFQALVAMGNLKVQLIDNKALLDWVRRSDKVAYFEVEKSVDGNNFTLLQKVWTDATNTYHYIYDGNLIEGDNFYRLKIVQSDGIVDYTPIQSVFYEKMLDFTVFPNPANDEAWIDVKRFEGRTLEISLSDVAGKVIHREHIDQATTAPHRLDLSGIQSGSYTLTIQTKGKRAVVRKLSIMK